MTDGVDRQAELAGDLVVGAVLHEAQLADPAIEGGEPLDLVQDPPEAVSGVLLVVPDGLIGDRIGALA
ncbi:hypothetical protein GCM10010988_10620 [Cnuibacter physcomitrellae]|nr:hypothetical protein [Cnuibacter physcomitrellae]GGI36772.1 hypothetical protein GCM10010988_10620 [Cnuibacter physcomitrellae]